MSDNIQQHIAEILSKDKELALTDNLLDGLARFLNVIDNEQGFWYEVKYFENLTAKRKDCYRYEAGRILQFLKEYKTKT